MRVINRYIGGIFSIGVFLFLIYYFSQLFTWIIAAWVLSLVASPFMQLLDRIRIGRFALPSNLKAGTVIIVFLGVCYLVLASFVPLLIQQGRNLAGVNYNAVIGSLEEPINEVNNWLVERGFIEGELVPETLDSLAQKTPPIPSNDSLTQLHTDINLQTPHHTAIHTSTISVDSVLLANGDTVTKTNIALNIHIDAIEPQSRQDSISDHSAIVQPHDGPMVRLQKRIYGFFNPNQIPEVFSYAIGLIGNVLIGFTSILFIAFFFIKDNKLFGTAIKAAVPTQHSDNVDHALKEIKRLLTRYFSGIVLQVTIIIIYISSVLWILGVPNTLLIAFFVAIMNVIPFVGPLIGGTFGLFITVSSNLELDFYTEMLPLLIKVVAVIAGMQALDNFVLQPVIFSNSVSAHPLEIFIVIIVGAQLAGILGMVAAVPVYTVLRVVASVFLSEFKLVQKLTAQIQIPDDDDEPDSVKS